MGQKGGSTSKTSTDKSTDIETNTTTNIRDIGFTGDDAIELAAIVQEGIIGQTRAVQGIISPIVENASAGFSQLVAASQVEQVSQLSPAAQAANFELQKSPEQILAGKAPLILVAIAGTVGLVLAVRASK